MSSYNSQYKRYYQELQNKNLGGNTSPVYRRNTFEDVYGNGMKKDQKKDFFSSMVNVFIYLCLLLYLCLWQLFI